MHYIAIIVFCFLGSLSHGSGCNWNDHSIDGWSRSLTEIIELEPRLFKTADLQWSCQNWGHATIQFKGEPDLYKFSVGNCQDLYQLIKGQNDKFVNLIHQNIQFQAYDNCGSDVDGPTPSGQLAVEFFPDQSHSIQFLSPLNPEDGLRPIYKSKTLLIAPLKNAKKMMATCEFVDDEYKILEASISSLSRSSTASHADVVIYQIDKVTGKKAGRLKEYQMTAINPNKASLSYNFENVLEKTALSIFVDDVGGMSTLTVGEKQNHLTCAF